MSSLYLDMYMDSISEDSATYKILLNIYRSYMDSAKGLRWLKLSDLDFIMKSVYSDRVNTNIATLLSQGYLRYCLDKNPNVYLKIYLQKMKYMSKIIFNDINYGNSNKSASYLTKDVDSCVKDISIYISKISLVSNMGCDFEEVLFEV